MTLIAATYGYARVSKADAESKNLDTQLLILAEHGIRSDMVYSAAPAAATCSAPAGMS